MARTIATEDSTPEGRAAVASVMMNRLRSGEYPSTMSGVILQRNAFEPVGSARWRSLSPSSPDYQAAYEIARRVAGGEVDDPTNGSVLFYSPTAQAYLGRSAPQWSVGRAPETMIGGQAYYRSPNAPKQVADDSFLKDFEVAPAGGSTPAKTAPDDFLRDFEVAPPSAPGKATTPATAAPAANAPSFEKDYPVAPPVAATRPTPPTTAQGVDAEFLNSIPVVGPSLVKAGAAVNAGLAPFAPYLGGAYGALTGTDTVPQGNTFGERYANALAGAERDRQAFETNQPFAAGATTVGGALTGAAGAIAAAPAAFGVGSMSLPASAALSSASGAAISAADTAARQGFDRPSILHSAELGGAFGAAAPAAGRLIGSGVNVLSNLVSRTTPAARNVAGVLANIGMTPQDAQNALTRMGPNATLADIDPALTAEAGGLAAKGGAPTSVLKSAMAARAAGANDRVASAVDQYLGPRPDLTASQQAIQAKASADAAPYYNAARASAQPMDITPVLSAIDQRLAGGATGGVKDALTAAKGYLTKEVATLPSGPGNATSKIIVPKDDPQSLLEARQALDDFIERRGDAETSAGKNALRAAQNVRAQLDGVLKADPNIAAGDAAYSTQMRNLDAMQEGQNLFKPATRIEDVNRSIAGKTPDQIYNMRQGALSAIHDALDNARQGDFSAARSLFAKATANRAKLDALFPNAGKIFDTVESEIAMRGTENAVAQNSATAQRQAILQKYAVPTVTPLDTGAAIAGEALAGGPGAVAGIGAKALYSHARNALLEAAANRLSTSTARGLAATGPAQQEFLAQIARASRTGGAANALSNAANVGVNLLTRTAGPTLLNYLGGR